MGIIDMILSKAVGDSPLAYEKNFSASIIGDPEGKEPVGELSLSMGDDSTTIGVHKFSDFVPSYADFSKATVSAQLPVDGTYLVELHGVAEFEHFAYYVVTIESEAAIFVFCADTGGEFDLGDAFIPGKVTLPGKGLYYSFGPNDVDGSLNVDSRFDFSWSSLKQLDPKFIPALDSLTLNSPSGKQYKVTVDDTGALTTTEVTA